MMRLTDSLAVDLDRAFPRLVDAHVGLLYAIAVNTCSQPADAEDAVAESFYRAYRALRGYEPERIRSIRLRAWLVTILLNVRRNETRRRRRHPESPVAYHEDRAGAPAAEDEALSLFPDPALTEALQQIAPAPRRALLLRHVAGMSYADIAEVTDRPVGTVKSQVARTANRLRRILDTKEES